MQKRFFNFFNKFEMKINCFNNFNKFFLKFFDKMSNFFINNFVVVVDCFDKYNFEIAVKIV